MYVCICNNVTDGDIRNAVAGGIHSMEGLCSQLKISSCCGRCADCARKVMHQAMALNAISVSPLSQTSS